MTGFEFICYFSVFVGTYFLGIALVPGIALRRSAVQMRPRARFIFGIIGVLLFFAGLIASEGLRFPSK